MLEVKPTSYDIPCYVIYSPPLFCYLMSPYVQIPPSPFWTHEFFMEHLLFCMQQTLVQVLWMKLQKTWFLKQHRMMCLNQTWQEAVLGVWDDGFMNCWMMHSAYLEVVAGVLEQKKITVVLQLCTEFILQLWGTCICCHFSCNLVIDSNQI